MRPKIQNLAKIRSNLEKTARAKRGKTNPKLCQLCEKGPKQVLTSLCIRTRRRHIYTGLYTVLNLYEDKAVIIKVCRQCFHMGKYFRFLCPARPPGSARRRRL